MGDWLRFGNEKWGEKYSQAARITGYDRKSLRNMAWVASRFEPSRRRRELTFGHHAIAAPLAPDDQDRWLDRAIGDGLSVNDLRIEIKAERRGSATQASEPDDTVDLPTPVAVTCPGCGLKFDPALVDESDCASEK